jgi:genome maintenance exonuclease 1
LKAKDLQRWRERVGIEEANKIGTQARVRGTAFHNICEKFLLNDPDYKKGTMPINLADFKKIAPILKENVGLIRGIELKLYSETLNCAGTCDLISEWKGELSIVDFKTARKNKSEETILTYFLQATCYAIMAEELYDLDIPNIVIVMSVDHESPLIFEKKKSKYVDKVYKVFAPELRRLKFSI